VILTGFLNLGRKNISFPIVHLYCKRKFIGSNAIVKLRNGSIGLAHLSKDRINVHVHEHEHEDEHEHRNVNMNMNMNINMYCT
jgi:hypothetical protein